MESLSGEELLAQYTYTPVRVATGMVTPVRLPAKPNPRFWETTSGLGRLDKLPVEVLCMSFTYLDFVSLINISCTARRGHELIMAMPDYADALQFAGPALAALADTRILGAHTVASIIYALRSAECVSCGNFGALLFLLECERVCWKCLSQNQSLWVMPRQEAGGCFNLSAEQLQQLPCFRSIPGTKYFVGHQISHGESCIMVGVRAAKRLALQVHGSEEALQAYLESRRSAVEERYYHAWFHLHLANLVFTRHDPCAVFCLATIGTGMGRDNYNGMASVLFPYQASSNTPADGGVWCRGCEWTWIKHHTIPRDMQGLFPDEYHMYTWFDLALRERTPGEFLAHAQRCYGVRKMVQRKQEGKRDVFTGIL
ncbi:hypothetical protein NQ176_g2801 [Zarea fungicola]|uniref:Uncharacterized protein n=1 Tax=Zarea fungicola TaxID=93591 RepID=A0ACC1NM73_9HYPO|nr:hypothetical protein NQ176_g2801 [Lecanicillium fungicola]